MTLDEQLQRAFETLGERLRHEIARELRAAAEDVAAQAKAECDARVTEAAARARAETEAAARNEIARAVGAATADLAAKARAERDTAVAEAGTRARAQADAAAREEIARLEQRSHQMVTTAATRLLDAVRGIDRAHALSEILETLASCAGRVVARAGVLLTHGDDLRGYRFIGFGPDFESASPIVIHADESGILGEAILTREAIVSDGSGQCSAPALVGLPRGRTSVAVPIVMSGQVIAVLYGDQGIGNDDERRGVGGTWPQTLEVLARHAARCLEATTAIKAMRVPSGRPELSGASSTERVGAGRADVEP